MEFAGDLETHWTLLDDRRRTPEQLVAIARRHGLKCTHVVLDRGTHASQPMFTRRRNGRLSFELADAQAMAMRLGNEGLDVRRVKIEAATTNEDVPTSDDAAAIDASRCFEHHVKVRARDDDELARLGEVASAHRAHLSRNAMRALDDGTVERFVTQRCYGVGAAEAKRRLTALVGALTDARFAIVAVDEEYVVYDSNTALDAGWIDEPGARPKRPDYPRTFLDLPSPEDAPRKQLFDPALKHFSRAFRQGEPALAHRPEAQAWKAMRRRALEHVLRVVAESSWSELLVLRGSVLLAAWLGDAARDPGDLDWVVDPPSLSPDGEHARDMLATIVELVRTTPAPEGPRISAPDVAVDAIWTYERAEGRRVVFPWHADGLPSGTVQLDFVFHEELPAAPARVEVPSVFGRPIALRAATPELSLAWKLLWLSTDMHPQGKDLYDATLLAEKFPIARAFVEQVVHAVPDGERIAVTADMPRAWNVEWDHLRKEYPRIEGDAESYKDRLSRALARSFG